jgi:3-hydroxyisobutyrate dehydrogenase-like beta-hydroxyacid dehydrogenase
LLQAQVRVPSEISLTIVWGAPPAADAGQLVCVLAGPADAVNKIKPYTKGVIGRELIEMADAEPGKALVSKLIGNMFILNLVASLAEGITVAEKSGMGMDTLQKFVELMLPGPYVGYFHRMVNGDYHKKEVCLFGSTLLTFSLLCRRISRSKMLNTF